MSHNYCINKRIAILFSLLLIICLVYFSISSSLLTSRNALNSRAEVPKGPSAILSGYNSSFDYVLYITLSNGTTSFSCTGVLISSTRALTAKHCFDPYDGKAVNITSMSNYYDSTSSRFADAEHKRVGSDITVVHCKDTKNCPDSSSDLTLLKINTPYNKVQKFPSYIGIPSDNYSKGTVVTVSGWGAIEVITPTPSGSEQYKFPTRQQSGSLKVSSDYPYTFRLESRFWSKTKTRSGDSGGPVVKGDKLIGVISESSETQSICIRLLNYESWIKNQ